MSPIDIRFGGYQAPASIHNRAATFLGERLRERLGARLGRFELIGNVLALGRRSGDLPLMVLSGELDFCYMATLRFTQWVPEFRILELPFVVERRDIVQRALAGELGTRFARQMDLHAPLKLLGVWDNGFRHFTNKVRPIRTPADCRGLRIRTQMSELIGESLAAMGFIPIPVDIKEFTEQVAGDRFDAQENPLTNIYNFGVHNHHRYITLSGHFFGGAALVCSQARYAGWPEAVRAALDEAAREATVYQHELAAAEDDQILAKIDPARNEIIRLTASEHASFVAAVRPVIDKHRGELDPALFGQLS